MKLSYFIAFEGIDGSGKSTQIRLLHAARKNCATLLHCTSEPHTGIIGSFIRTLLSSSDLSRVPDSSLFAYLFAADRHEHLYAVEGVVAHLKRGITVLSDRYLFSSIAYQGDEESKKLTYELNKDFPMPDLVFYFDVDVDIALSRLPHKKEILERKKMLLEVRHRYETLFFSHESPDHPISMPPIVRVDATKDVSSIHATIIASLHTRFGLFPPEKRSHHKIQSP